jgi:hypothetical protein
MIRNPWLSGIALVAFTPIVADAQSGHRPQTTPSSEAPPAASDSLTVKQGREVQLKLGQRLSVETSMLNAPVELVLDEDLKADDVLVASKGARVIGRVTEGKKDCANRPCGWRDQRVAGKQLSIRLEYIVTPYGKIPLTGEQHAQTHHNTGAIVASTAAFGLTGLFISMAATTKTVLEENTPVVATVASDFGVPLPPGSH